MNLTVAVLVFYCPNSLKISYDNGLVSIRIFYKINLFIYLFICSVATDIYLFYLRYLRDLFVFIFCVWAFVSWIFPLFMMFCI